jgi:integrase
LYKNAKIQTRKEGFENLDVHSLRKSAGSFLMYAGTSVFDVKEFLAHSSITTIEKHWLR